jgi:hypothetical protein
MDPYLDHRTRRHGHACLLFFFTRFVRTKLPSRLNSWPSHRSSSRLLPLLTSCLIHSSTVATVVSGSFLANHSLFAPLLLPNSSTNHLIHPQPDPTATPSIDSASLLLFLPLLPHPSLLFPSFPPSPRPPYSTNSALTDTQGNESPYSTGDKVMDVQASAHPRPFHQTPIQTQPLSFDPACRTRCSCSFLGCGGLKLNLVRRRIPAKSISMPPNREHQQASEAGLDGAGTRPISMLSLCLLPCLDSRRMDEGPHHHIILKQRAERAQEAGKNPPDITALTGFYVLTRMVPSYCSMSIDI